MSDLARRMLGEMTDTGNVAPTMSGPGMGNLLAQGARRRIPPDKSDKRRKLQSRIVAGMIGTMTEDEQDGSVIPDDARDVDSVQLTAVGVSVGGEVEEPDRSAPTDPYVQDEDGLIEPSMALVAPDTTPHALTFLDPSMVPNAPRSAQPTRPAPARPAMGGGMPAEEPSTNAMNLLLGRTGKPSPSSIAPQPYGEEMPLESAPAIVRPPLTEEELLAEAGREMPEHKQGDVRKTMAAFRMFAGG